MGLWYFVGLGASDRFGSPGNAYQIIAKSDERDENACTFGNRKRLRTENAWDKGGAGKLVGRSYSSAQTYQLLPCSFLQQIDHAIREPLLTDYDIQFNSRSDLLQNLQLAHTH